MRNQGFSLIELTMIIMIIGIIIAIAVPTMENYLANYQLHSTCLQLQQHIRSVAQEALVKDCDNYYILLYLEQDKYKIVAPLDNKNSTMITLPDGVDLAFSNFRYASSNTDNNNRIIFSGKGRPVVGGIIRLESKKTGKIQYVIVATITGRTRISDKPPLNNEVF